METFSLTIFFAFSILKVLTVATRKIKTQQQQGEINNFLFSVSCENSKEGQWTVKAENLFVHLIRITFASELLKIKFLN